MKQTSVDPDQNLDAPEVNEEKFRQVMESRWRYAVFPAMVTFVLLIGFMFYLIYGMLQRMEDLSENIDKMTGVISDSLPVMQGGVVSMSSRMQWVGDDLKKMTNDVNNMSRVLTTNMPAMTRSIDGMTNDVSSMTYAANSMSATTHNMGQNLWDMNRNISGGPFGMMKDMMPFSKKSAPPPRPLYNDYAQPYDYYGQQQWPQGYGYGYGYAPAFQPASGNGGYADPGQLAMNGVAVATSSPAATAGVGESKYAGFCASCHGISGEGGVGPSLSGHTSSGVEKVMGQYRSGELKGTMTGVAKEMTDHDIQSIAHFVEATF